MSWASSIENVIQWRILWVHACITCRNAWICRWNSCNTSQENYNDKWSNVSTNRSFPVYRINVWKPIIGIFAIQYDQKPPRTCTSSAWRCCILPSRVTRMFSVRSLVASFSLSSSSRRCDACMSMRSATWRFSWASSSVHARSCESRDDD